MQLEYLSCLLKFTIYLVTILKGADKEKHQLIKRLEHYY